MTPKELEAARTTLGAMWGLTDRDGAPAPLTAADLGRLLHIDRRDPGAVVRQWEAGQRKDGVPGPVRAYVEALLAGYVPPGAPQGSAAPMGQIPATISPAKNRRRG